MSVPQRRTWTVEEYHRAAAAGVFASDERLELVDGAIYRVGLRSSRHLAVIGRSADALRGALGEGFSVRTRFPLRSIARSEPEPDLAIVRGTWDDAADAANHTVELLVEATETSSHYLGRVKGSLYAQAGIPEYWVLMINSRFVFVHRDPDRASGIYRTIIRVGEAEVISPLVASGARLAAADFFGREGGA
jgi:Uma2 family endonuclease